MNPLRRVVVAAMLALLPGASFAQTYPDKPIRIVHGFAAGGGADLLLRTILPALSDAMGVQEA